MNLTLLLEMRIKSMKYCNAEFSKYLNHRGKLRFEEPKECIFSNIYTMTQQLSLASAITRKQARAY